MLGGRDQQGQVFLVGLKSPKEIQQDFETRFARSCEVSGDVFLQATPDDIKQFARKVAGERNKQIPTTLTSTTWAQSFPG